MSAESEISVVIPTYNRGHCVGMAIESVLAQRSSPRELIVVDDGSTDDTADVLKHFGGRIRVLRQENSGVSAARNAGVLAASGEWVAFLDSDDEWDGHMLEKQIRAVQSDRSVVVSGANGLVFPGAGQAPVDFFSTRHRTRGLRSTFRIDDPLEWALDTVVMTPGLMARRAAIVDAGLFDVKLTMFEDLDLLIRLAMAGPWLLIPDRLFRVHRRGPVGASLSEQSASRIGHSYESLIRVYTKFLGACPDAHPALRAVRRKLASVRADLAAAERRALNPLRSTRLFLRSFWDSPCLASAARAVAGIVAGERGISWLRRLRGGQPPTAIR